VRRVVDDEVDRFASELRDDDFAQTIAVGLVDSVVRTDNVAEAPGLDEPV
jgi:hypothetical protein